MRIENETPPGKVSTLSNERLETAYSEANSDPNRIDVGDYTNHLEGEYLNKEKSSEKND